MSFNDFIEFLNELAKSKKIDVADMKTKLVSCGSPGTSQTTKAAGGAAGAAMDRLTDTSKYTGSHKERFDESGKGKGIEGRMDLSKNTGYVQGYKQEDTYNKDHGIKGCCSSDPSATSPPCAPKTVSAPAPKEASTPTQKDASIPTQKEASTPTQKEASSPAQKEASTPTQKEASSPAQKEASTPTQKEASTPTQKEASSPPQKEANTPTQKEASTPAPKATIPPAPKPETPAPSSSGSSDVTMKSQFAEFAAFGVKDNKGTITLKNSDKWMQQARVFGKTLTTTDTAITFSKIAKKEKTIDMAGYMEFLNEIAKSKKMDVDELKRKMFSCGSPGTSGTTKASGGAAGAAMDRLTDTSKYTGSHKERFDESGKGKGIEGRMDLSKNTGYVQGYKQEDTYDKKH